MFIKNLLMTQMPKKPTTIQKMIFPAYSMFEVTDGYILIYSSSVSFFGRVEALLMNPAMIDIA